MDLLKHVNVTGGFWGATLMVWHDFDTFGGAGEDHGGRVGLGTGLALVELDDVDVIEAAVLVGSQQLFLDNR